MNPSGAPALLDGGRTELVDAGIVLLEYEHTGMQ
jgi:hypothetical protein